MSQLPPPALLSHTKRYAYIDTYICTYVPDFFVKILVGHKFCQHCKTAEFIHNTC